MAEAKGLETQQAEGLVQQWRGLDHLASQESGCLSCLSCLVLVSETCQVVVTALPLELLFLVE